MLTTYFFKKGSQVIATIDVITSVLSFISIFLLISLTFTHHFSPLEKTVVQNEDKHPELAALFALGRAPFNMIMLVLMSICIFYFYLARYLLHAAIQRSYTKIHRWCTITLVIIITRAAFFITAVFFTQDRAFVSSFGLIGFLYQIFCLWFVRIFHDRLRIEIETKLTFMDELGQAESFAGKDPYPTQFHPNHQNVYSFNPYHPHPYPPSEGFKLHDLEEMTSNLSNYEICKKVES